LGKLAVCRVSFKNVGIETQNISAGYQKGGKPKNYQMYFAGI
jgi:hypothetical protein